MCESKSDLDLNPDSSLFKLDLDSDLDSDPKIQPICDIDLLAQP